MVQSQVKKDPKATPILDKTSEKFQSIGSFKATFTFQLKSRNEAMNEAYDGTIYVKGDMYRINTDDRVIFNNGKKIATMYVDEEVNINDYHSEDDPLSIKNVVNMYKKGYKYVLVGEETIGGVPCHVIDLEPDLSPEERARNQVYKIRLHIVKGEHYIKQWKVFERNGNRYTTTINTFTPSVKVSDSYFSFNREDYDIEVIDMSTN
jgi:outer membrane lipoprotein-sorting protein